MSDLPPPEVPLPTSRGQWIWLAVGVWIAACCIVLAVGLFLQWQMATTAALFGLLAIVPFPFVAMVQLGEYSSSARGVTVVGWCVAVLLGWCMTTLLVNAAYTTEGGLAPGGGQRTFIAFALAGLAAVTGFCCYLPFGRRLAARWLPIDPSSFTAATGLAVAIPLTMYSLIPLAVTGKVALNLAEANASTDTPPADFILPALGVQLVWLVLFAIVAGGFPVRRNWADTLNRLGVCRISLPVIGIAVVIAVAMVGVVLPMEVGVHSLWQRLGWPTTDEKALEQMLGGVKSWYGAIVIGFVAGISEELLVRGLLQPRLGLILSNLLFAAAHAYQYCWDGLLVVFFIGLVCGLVRKHYNTTASMIVHGLYDTILVLLATYAADWVH